MRTRIQQYLTARDMVHRACAAGWTLMEVHWTSTPIRNQRCTRIQIEFIFQASFGFEFEQDQSIRNAITPNLPLNPAIRAVEEEINSRKRTNPSPTESSLPSKRKRGTQTDVLGEHLDSLPRMYLHIFHSFHE